MDAMVSQITSLTIVYSTFYSGADKKNHQSSSTLAFGQGIHWRPVNSLHKWPVMRKMFPFDDVIMTVWEEYGCTTSNESADGLAPLGFLQAHGVYQAWVLDRRQLP